MGSLGSPEKIAFIKFNDDYKEEGEVSSKDFKLLFI